MHKPAEPEPKKNASSKKSVGKIEMEKRKEKIPLENILEKKNTAESTENTEKENVLNKNELNDIINPTLSTPNAANVSTHLI